MIEDVYEPLTRYRDDFCRKFAELTREMLEAADNLEFERAAYLRDQIAALKKSHPPV